MQLTGALIGWLIMGFITVLILFFGLIGLTHIVAHQYAIWRESKTRAGPSDQSGDDGGMSLSGLTREQRKYIKRINRAFNSYDPNYVIGGHPIRSKPFWRER